MSQGIYVKGMTMSRRVDEGVAWIEKCAQGRFRGTCQRGCASDWCKLEGLGDDVNLGKRIPQDNHTLEFLRIHQ